MSRRTTGLAVALILLFTSCGTSGLSFVSDERVKIVAPVDRAQVHLPVTIRWTVKDFTVTGPSTSTRGDAGYFGVFLDRAPQPPGKTFAYLARDDAQCKITPGCPDTTYFESIGAYSTTQTSFTIRDITERRREEERRLRDFHEVNVVLLDPRGQRIGESAFTVQFELKRDTV